MASLANKKIGDSFKDLLQISNNNSGIDGTVRFVEDGEGTQSVLGLDDHKITIDGHILPTTNAAYDIGSAEKKIRHLFLSDNSLYVGDVQLSSTDASNIKGLETGTYATTVEMNTGMATKADTSALNDYATTVEMNAGMATKADTTALGNYATAAAMTASMATKADTSALTNALNDFYSKSDIDIKLNDLPTLSDVNQTIQDVIGSAPAALDTLEEISSAINDDENYAATITSTLANKANTTDVNMSLANKANTTDVNTSLATKANTADMMGLISNYTTTADMNTSLSTKANTTDVNSGLAAKVNTVDMNTTLNSHLKSDIDDQFTGKLSVANTNQRTAGIYGLYDSYKAGHIWSMGTNFKINDDGSDFGNIYGFAYKYYPHNLTGGEMAGGHQAVWCMAGDPHVAIGKNIWAKNNITAFSDARVKKNIVTIPNAIDKVKAIRGVTYERTDLNVETENNVKQMGVIAQELVDVVPEVVTGGPTDDNPEGYYSVAYGNMVGLLIEAVKEQQVQLEEQKQLINQLLNK